MPVISPSALSQASALAVISVIMAAPALIITMVSYRLSLAAFALERFHPWAQSGKMLVFHQS